MTGGGPGLMEAANEEAKRADPDASDRSAGIRIALPSEQDENAFVTRAYQHRTFFTRLHEFVLMSDASVAVPGGIGTVLEAMMIRQLLQVRHIPSAPLVLIGKMYADLVAWCRQYMLRQEFPLASPEDLDLPHSVDDGPGTLQIIREHHARWVEAGKNPSPYVKDGINNYIVHGKEDAVNPEKKGTKVSAHYPLTLGAGESRTIRLRRSDSLMSANPPSPPFVKGGLGGISVQGGRGEI